MPSSCGKLTQFRQGSHTVLFEDLAEVRLATLIEVVVK